MSAPRQLRPPGWATPVGYAHGMSATGRVIVTAGQVGWNPETSEFESDDFAEQTARALQNVVALLEQDGAQPEHLVRLTWYVTDRDEYLAARKRLGVAYRSIIGKHFPAMTVVVVAGLLEPRAKVEIEATAVMPA